MHIDARSIDSQELLIRLKEILASNRGCNVDIEILFNTLDETKKINAFISMSGCRTEVEKKDECYIMHVRDIPCCT